MSLNRFQLQNICRNCFETSARNRRLNNGLCGDDRFQTSDEIGVFSRRVEGQHGMVNKPPFLNKLLSKMCFSNAGRAFEDDVLVAENFLEDFFFRHLAWNRQKSDGCLVSNTSYLQRIRLFSERNPIFGLEISWWGFAG